jgi:DUF4097 and DUF4098 domain-containing protein YvlB
MERRQCAAKLAALMLIASVAAFAASETRKEYRFTVGPQASVSINNQYGPISVKPGTGNQVVVRVLLRSDKVEVDRNQSGNRVDILSHLFSGATAETGKVDYEVLVPSDTNVTLRSTTGPMGAEKLQGDVSVEGATATVDVRDISNAHVHVKTLNGPVTLTRIQDGHVEITSVSGDVIMSEVSGPVVQVNSSSGKIRYEGDFGGGGEYSFTSHTGDIDATAPTYASIDVTARSVKGQVDNDFPLLPKSHISFPIDKARSLVGTAGKAASSVKLLSFSGKIHLKKR